MNEIRFSLNPDTIARRALEAAVPSSPLGGMTADLVIQAFASEVVEGRLVPPQVVHPDLEMRLRGARQIPKSPICLAKFTIC